MRNKFFSTKEIDKGDESQEASPLFRSKYLLAHYEKVKNLDKDLLRLPSVEEFFFLQSEAQFNAFTFIPAIAKLHSIEHLHATTYSISRRTIEAIVELHDKGFIDKVTLSISDSLIKRNPKTIDLLVAMISSRPNIKVLFTWSHAKVAILKAKENYFVIEGSGNWSENAHYEQYIFANSKKLYNFRKELFDNVNVRYTADSNGLIQNDH